MSAIDILGVCFLGVVLLDALGCLFFAWWADREAQKQARERQFQKKAS